MSIEVLIVDDEPDIRDLISDLLKDSGFVVKTAANSKQAFEAMSEKIPNLLLLDVWLQNSDLDGLGILELVKKRHPLLPVVVMSGHGTIDTAISAIKMGAYDYIEKPFTHEKLMISLKRAYEAAKLKRENIDLKNRVIDKTELIGTSHAMQKLKSEIEKAAPTSARVMLFGPSGTGKKLSARLIHKKSKRANNPFIIFSPGGMNANKIHQELFGETDKNDTNSASSKRISVLEAANNGTLYIDEIAELPLATQNKLLKFLQDQIFEKCGTNKKIKLDIRFITSSNYNLESEIAEGRFRQDLFYRLNVLPINVPKLSERKEDIPLLVEYFVKQLAKYSGLKERAFLDEAVAALQAYNWSGNIRQLRNVIEWTLIMNPLSITVNGIKANMLPPEITSNGITIANPESNLDMMSMPLREAREVFERQYLTAQMSRFNNNISKTSAFVGMERSALHRKLKLLNIHTSLSDRKEEEMEGEIA